ncbi:MAG TPA: methyl-accepting chemotaxis protein [Deltaproteobacteria bacterium]|nr:methyl-accepting chemotaxis protein [Deltaproteobacteria bacterium]
MAIRVPLGYKFILGFIAVVATAAFVPAVVAKTGMAEWLKPTVSFLSAILIGLIVGHLFTRAFTRDFNHLTAMARKISHGELGTATNGHFDSKVLRDETSDLAESIDAMASELREIVLHVKKTAQELAEAHETFNGVVARGHETAREIVAGTSKIFDGALEQSHHVDTASKKVEEMAALAEDVSVKVTDAARSLQKVNAIVVKGVAASGSVIEKIESIFGGIEKTEAAAKRLEDKLNDIPRILDVITHISRQTDLLALNATIEASKAGEHGRGFAMVAEEVRRFADNTNRSVDDVSRIVKELRIEVERVVSTAAGGATFLKYGRDDTRKIRDILENINDYSTDVAERAGLVLGVTERQKEMARESVEKMRMVADIAQDNLTGTERVEGLVEKHGAIMEETLKASAELSALSRSLTELVARFKVEAADYGEGARS